MILYIVSHNLYGWTKIQDLLHVGCEFVITSLEVILSKNNKSETGSSVDVDLKTETL